MAHGPEAVTSDPHLPRLLVWLAERVAPEIVQKPEKRLEWRGV